MLLNRFSDFFFLFFFRFVSLICLRACYVIYVCIIYVLKRVFNVSLKSCDIKSNLEREKSTKNFRIIRKYDVDDIYYTISKNIFDNN